MSKSKSCRISNELKSEITNIKRKIKKRIGISLTDVEITKLIARKIKKMPVRLKRIGRGYKIT